MRYGYFDPEHKEYVIDNPATPAPWVNYLGDPEYGAIISNNAAGYSFVKSGANGRITRFRFNSEMALPGRYIYLRDRKTGDYWSASWQPVGKPLDQYRSECRHGTGYTVISASYSGIRSAVTYYVPLGRTYEVWRLRITNETDVPRDLSCFGFVEFTNEDNYEQDQVNLQYSLFISRTERIGNKILQTLSKDSQKDRRYRFFGLAGAHVDAACGSLSDFIGSYRTYSNPIAVENGACPGIMNYNSNSCGALQTDLCLAPGETAELIYLLGQKDPEEADKILANYERPAADQNKIPLSDGKPDGGNQNVHRQSSIVDQEVSELKAFWHSRLEHFQVNTPSSEFNNMVNAWNAYQCFITFVWSRAASFIYCGLRNGYGYRDTVQDIQGIIHLDPEMAAEKIRFMLSAQVNNGAGLPLVKFTHNAGHENTPDDPDYVKETGHPSYRADDALWLFPTIYKYIGETGSLSFLNEVIVYANGGEATVYEHLKQAIQFSMEHRGVHRLPAGLHADWNDCLRLGSQGESVFVAFQLYQAMDIMKQFAGLNSDKDYLTWLGSAQEELADALAKCWDQDRFIRGIREDGVKVGAKDDPEANLWLNAQSWAVVSGFASPEQAAQCMDRVYDRLNTPYGAMLLDPPYKDHYFDGALMHIYNAGTKENGGIFSQSQGWLILAEALMGRGDKAFTYFMETAPAAMNDRAELRVIEPYAHGQFTEAGESPHAGRSHVHWLTGTASTVMVACVEGICGLRPDAGGLTISPSIPSAWDGFRMEKDFRGKKLHILVDNSAHAESGVRSLQLNGTALPGSYIPAELLAKENEILVTMG